MKSWLHYRGPKWNFEEQAREKKRWDNIPFILISSTEKGGPLDHLKRFLGRIGIIITMRIELPKEIFLRLFFGARRKDLCSL